MNLSYFLRDDGACGYYRMTLPMTRLARDYAEWNVKVIKPGDDTDTIAKALSADLVVIPRPHESRILDTITRLKDLGTAVALDFDDDLFCVSPLSPHYEEFGTKNVRYRMPDGRMVTVWKDGEKGFSIARNQAALDALKRACELADAVTVTTDLLAERYADYTRRTVVLPNCLDLAKYRRLPLLPRPTRRIGWHGGSSHFEDFSLLSEVLPAIMAQDDELTLVLFGAKFDATVKGVPRDRLEFHGWEPTPALPYKLATLDLDVAVIPLCDTTFNAAKSAIKWLEYGALSVPAVTSYVSPYKEIATDKNGIFIDGNGPDAWLEGLRMLLNDPMQRAAMGHEARRTVEEVADIDRQVWRWHAAYTEVLTAAGVT